MALLIFLAILYLQLKNIHEKCLIQCIFSYVNVTNLTMVHIVNRDVLWTKEFSSQERQGTTTTKSKQVVQLQTPTSLNGTTLQNGTHQMASNWAEDYLKEVPELKTNGAANQLYGNILYSWLCLPSFLAVVC